MSVEIRTPQETVAFLPSSDAMREKIMQAHEYVSQFPQVDIATEHLLHAGMYVRTIRVPAGTVLIASMVKRATVLIVNGRRQVLAGDNCIEQEGYNVVAGCAGRQQVSVTHSDVEVTMIFRTDAKTVEEAEDEVFAEAELLMSRADGSRDTITVTGE